MTPLHACNAPQLIATGNASIDGTSKYTSDDAGSHAQCISIQVQEWHDYVIYLRLSPMATIDPEKSQNSNSPDGVEVIASDERLFQLGYQPQFRREMTFSGVLGVSFCAIGILTGMSSAFQTGLFSGGPLGAHN